MKQRDQGIQGRLGEPLVIELDANPTTGYQWLAAFPGDKLRLVEQQFRPGGAGIGAAGRERFVFEALAKGDSVVEFTYKRAWEAQGIERRAVRVRVQ